MRVVVMVIVEGDWVDVVMVMVVMVVVMVMVTTTGCSERRMW